MLLYPLSDKEKRIIAVGYWVIMAGVIGTLIFLLVGGCHFSLIDKGKLDQALKQAVTDAPIPFIDVQGPPPEKVVDWPEIIALAGMIAGSMAHRYLYHRKAKEVILSTQKGNDHAGA